MTTMRILLELFGGVSFGLLFFWSFNWSLNFIDYSLEIEAAGFLLLSLFCLASSWTLVYDLLCGGCLL